MLGLAAIVLAVAARRGRPRDDVRFALGFGSLLIVQLLVSAALYGRATGSGYGDAANLFAIEAIPRNVAMYAKWFLRLQTPLVPAVVAAAWLVGDRFVRTAFLLFAAVAAPYLLYVPFFDDWETLRFLLPGRSSNTKIGRGPFLGSLAIACSIRLVTDFSTASVIGSAMSNEYATGWS